MKEEIDMNKKALFAALLGTVLVLGACGNSDKDEKVEPETEEATKEVETPTSVDKSETTSTDEDLKEEFAKEEGVSNVSIIVTEDAGGFVLVDFEVTEDMEEKQAEEVINKFVEQIKEKHADYNIDVQARKNGETFSQKTIE